MSERYCFRNLVRTVIVCLLATVTGATVTVNAAVVASDNFNRSNESPFAVSGNWGQTLAGPFAGNATLTGNQVASAANEGIYYWRGAGTFDNTRQFAKARITQGNAEAGLVLLGGTNHAIMVSWGPPNGGGTVYIYWYNGVGTTGGQLSASPSIVHAGDTVEAVLDGGTIFAKVNGSIVASTSNTTSLTSGTPGFVTYQPGATLDDWQAGTLPPVHIISGTITQGGSGQSGVLVMASGGFVGSATTNGSGNYTITGVTDGSTGIVLTPLMSGRTFTPATRTVAGPVTGDVTGQVFTSSLNSSLGAADNFNRPNETPFAVGLNWAQISVAPPGGSVNLTNNQVVSAVGEALYRWQGAGTFDNTRQFVRGRVVQTGGQVGLVLLGGSGQGIVVSWGGGTLYIYWYVGGAYQGNLTTASSTLQVGDVIEAVLADGRVYAKINGSVIASTANTTSLLSGTPGFEAYQPGAAVDDWEAGTPQIYAISGTITEGGIGLSGVQVSSRGGFVGSALTDTNGNYSIANATAGSINIVLTPTKAGHTFGPQTSLIAGPLTGNVTGQNFTSIPDQDLVAFDDFDRASQSPFPVGANWAQIAVTPPGGSVQLVGNHIVSAGGEALYYWQGNGTFSNTRQFPRLKVVQAGGQVGLVLLGGSNQALVVSWNAGILYVYWYLNGSHQGELVHVPSFINDGDIIEAVLDNGVIQAKINGVVVRSVANTTSLTAGRPGFETFQTGAIFDDWVGGISPAYVNVVQSGGGTNVAEGGVTDTYMLVLNSVPASDVTIAFNTGSQISAISPVIFTAANWNVAQTITVSALDDANVEGTHAGTISHSATSNDANYNGIGIASVTVNITDNDVANACPRGLAYWKSHADAWPANALPMMLGTSRTYTKLQLLTILNTPVGSGGNVDVSLFLADELIAAKLNVAAGVVARAPIPATIVAADGAIRGNAIPMGTRLISPLGLTMGIVGLVLDGYNIGLLNNGCPLFAKTEAIVLNETPDNFTLEQNYPNPFNPTTVIEYSLPKDEHVTLRVFNTIGQEVVRLVDEVQTAGYKSVTFDAAGLSSGVYFYRIEAGSFTSMKKLMLLK